jgi:A/G-specific adenine glycosylase
MSTRNQARSPSLADALPERSWFAALRRRLIAWYARSARDLPWRRSGDPYAVWVSEIMLQQTQVATVKPYFERFLRQLPTIDALAQADEEAVLLLWEGLGYYRRARQLHRAARTVASEHAGRFPRQFDAVRRLPGIGRYTAGAILSIAFDQPRPILEANTVRLWSRLLGCGGPSTTARAQQLLWGAAEAILPRRGAGRVNQALMELGSQACLARGPRCETCPAAPLCAARSSGRQAEIPAKVAKPAFEHRREAAVVVRRNGRVLLGKCGESGRWAGLWDFPRCVVTSAEPGLRREIARKVLQSTGASIELGPLLATIKHGVTRFRITLDCYEATCRALRRCANGRAVLRWVRPAELDRYPLNSTGRRLSRMLGRGGD